MASDGARIRTALDRAVSGHAGTAAASRLCRACVELFDVDGAALSVMSASTQATFAASDAFSRGVDALQFDLGEGPCLESVERRRAVLVDDLEAPSEQRWPAFADAALQQGVRAVFALPVSVASTCVGALDLVRLRPGPLVEEDAVGSRLAAELAALPLLDLIGDIAAAPAHGPGGTDELASLERVEIYQATGMLMDQLDVEVHEALARLRAHAFAEGLTASEVAWAIVERRLRLERDPQAGA